MKLVSEKDYISHHGIKGQKWGIRRFQNLDGSLTEAGKQRYSSEAKNNEESLAAAAVILGFYTVPIAGAVAADAIRKGAAKVRTNKAIQRALNAEIDSVTGIPLKSEPMTADEDMKLANPGRGNGKRETAFNCVFCSTAYDLRRRGFEVTAKETTEPIAADTYEKFYKGAKCTQVIPAGHDSVFNALSTNPWAMTFMDSDFRAYHKAMKSTLKNDLLAQGDGARGYFGVTWFGQPGGHSMIYEVQNGKIVLRDCQIGKVINLNQVLDSSSMCRYTRIDDKEPNLDELRKAGAIK